MRTTHIMKLMPIMMMGFLLLAGCEGDQGPEGLVGPAGVAGSAKSYTGTAALADGPADEGHLVVLHALDANGEIIAGLSSGFTASDGSFEVPASDLVASSQLAFQALVGEEVFMAFVADTMDVVVGPVSQGVFEMVRMIVGTPGGRSVSDFAPEGIKQLVTAADAALQTAGTDLSDPEAVLDQLLTDLGGEVADLSGGVINLGPTTVAVSVDPPDVLTQIDAFDIDLIDGGNEFWDVRGDGQISDGTSDSYDNMFGLSIDGFAFPTMIAGGADTQIEDGNEVVLGPVADVGGLEVTRKIFVSPDHAFARFTEILTNNGGSAVTVEVMIDGNLGSDESTDAVQFSSNGNTSADEGDVWIAMHWDSSDPALGFFFPGATPSKDADDVEYVWSNLEIAAGETVVLMHWGFQLTGGPVSEIAANLALLEQVIPTDYFTGLSIAESAAGVYAGIVPNFVGEAGSVAPRAEVSLVNQRSGTEASRTATSDGSFSLILRDTESGDTVQITASDGTDETVTVP